MRDLSTQEEIQLAIDQNVARIVNAKRQQEENQAEAGRLENANKRFALLERKVAFGVELGLTAICLIALPYFVITDPESVGTVLSGVGTLGGIVSLLLRKRRGRTAV